jgi:hypothetical protein
MKPRKHCQCHDDLVKGIYEKENASSCNHEDDFEQSSILLEIFTLLFFLTGLGLFLWLLTSTAY